MKVWVVGRNYPSSDNNRQGSFELEQAKMLGKRGNDVTFIACVLHPFWRINGGGFVSFEDSPVKVRAYSGFFTPHMTNPLIQAPYFPKLRNRKWSDLLERVEKETGLPDVIHIHFPLMVLASEVFKKYHDKGVRIVVTEHWSKVLNQKIDVFEKRQMMDYLAFVDSYSCVGFTLKDAIIKLSGTKRQIDIIPNVVNDIFQPVDKDNRYFVFGVVGRLAPEKQIDKVITAFAELFRGDNTKLLVLIGNGKEYRQLFRLSKRLGIDKQVLFKGTLSREDTAKELGRFNCLICFSTYETFGVPVIEAWACGIPVITTTASSLMENWDEKMGISIRYDDMEALKKALKQIVENEKEYDADRIVEAARDKYSEEVIYRRLTELYERKRNI